MPHHVLLFWVFKINGETLVGTQADCSLSTALHSYMANSTASIGLKIHEKTEAL
jgi:hypothetical protein